MRRKLSELAGGGRLAGALQAGEQHDRRRARSERDSDGRPAHQRGELLVDDLHDDLARVQATDHVLAEAAPLDRLRERLDDLEVDVRLEQREADLAHRAVDVLLGQRPVGTQIGEGCLKLLGEGVEHRGAPTRRTAEAAEWTRARRCPASRAAG